MKSQPLLLQTVHIVWRSTTLPWWWRSANTQRSQIFLPGDSKSQDPPPPPHDLHQAGNMIVWFKSIRSSTDQAAHRVLFGGSRSSCRWDKRGGSVNLLTLWRMSLAPRCKHPSMPCFKIWIAKIKFHPSKVLDWEKEGEVPSSVSHFLGVFWICKKNISSEQLEVCYCWWGKGGKCGVTQGQGRSVEWEQVLRDGKGTLRRQTKGIKSGNAMI